MSSIASAEAFDTIVIGAGQAGLAAGYYLKEQGRSFAILGAEGRVGDTWRGRWESLRLFTPARYSSLPGMPFPAAPYHLPSKDEVADYLEAYASHFILPVRLRADVRRLTKDGDTFRAHTDEQVLTARNVVVATGAFREPKVPGIAGEISESVRQLHSSAYVRPSQLPDGPVLVVGAGNSGAQIALELAETRKVWLSGPDVGKLPRRLLGRDIYTWIWPTILHAPVSGRLGARPKARRFSSSDPLIGVDLAGAPPTLHRVGRTIGTRGGKPVLKSGEVLDVASVVWCTGFEPDYDWIELDVLGEDGYPRHERGASLEVPGLYFLGLRWLSRRKSSLVGGVGGDAAYVAGLIKAREARAITVRPGGAAGRVIRPFARIPASWAGLLMSH